MNEEDMDVKGYEEVRPDNEIWLPKVKDDELQGVIMEKQEEGKDYGLQCQIEDKEGKKWLTPSHKELQRRLEKLDVDDEILIIYRGNKPTSKGHPLELYLVYKKVKRETYKGVKDE